MIVGLEGVSCTGKSRLARSLASRLGDTAVVPCYYHAAPDPSALPSLEVSSEADQLDALIILLQIEETRLLMVRDGLRRCGRVVLDRTVDTLLAHVRAVGEMNGLNANACARALVTRQIGRGLAAVPDVTLLLRADHEVLVARARSRPGLPPLYYDQEFTLGFDAHFQDPITPACFDVDAGLPADQVLEQAWRLLGPCVGSQQ